MEITELGKIIEINNKKCITINDNFTIFLEYTDYSDYLIKIKDIHNNLNNVPLTNIEPTNNKLSIKCIYKNNNIQLFNDDMYTKYDVSFDFLVDSDLFSFNTTERITIYEKQLFLIKNVTYCIEICIDKDNHNKNLDGYYSFRYGYETDLLRCCFNLSQKNNKRYFRVEKDDYYWLMVLPINFKEHNKGEIRLYNYMYINDVCDKVYGLYNKGNIDDYYLLENLLNKYYIKCEPYLINHNDNYNDNYKIICIIKNNCPINKNIMDLIPYYLQKHSKSGVIQLYGSDFNIYNNSLKGTTNINKDLIDKHNFEHQKKWISSIILSYYQQNNTTYKLTFVIGIVTLNRIDYFKKMVNSLLLNLDNNNMYHIVIADGNCNIDKDKDKDYYNFYLELIESIKTNYDNINLIVIKNNIRYIYVQSNSILKYASFINFDYGFILNDDIIFNKQGWDNVYYDISKKYNVLHMCYNLNNDKTIILNNDLKSNGSVLNNNGILITFNKAIINAIGYYDEKNFKMRGHSHLDYSYRCCKLGYNNSELFMDINKSNEYITLMKDDYRDSMINDKYYDKDLFFANAYECDRRINAIINNKDVYKQTIIDNNYKLIITSKININNRSIFNKYNVYQVHISPGLSHFKDRIKKYYNLVNYTDIWSPSLFFGMYEDLDLDILVNHKGKKYILWGGTDANPSYPKFDKIVNRIQQLKIEKHFAISQDLANRLTNVGFDNKLIKFSLVDQDIFKPISSKGNKIFIYNGYREGLTHLYGENIYTEVTKLLPQYEYVYSNKLNKSYEEMFDVYKDCFICLRLTDHDGNANTVQEFEAMNIPVVHNQSSYGLKWSTINDVINHIKSNTLNKLNNNKIDFYHNNTIDNKDLIKCYENIDIMTKYLYNYKNILFICSDYPGYGGAATNCNNLQLFFSKYCNTYTVYYNFDGDKNVKYDKNDNYIIVDEKDVELTLKTLTFIPDILILKNYVNIDLKNMFNCPILYFIAGIYRNDLDRYYNSMRTKDEHNRYINRNVLMQINNSDYAFCNSSHTQMILKEYYNLDTYLFYSGLIPFYGKEMVNDNNFETREYEYGIIVSNFDRRIKNILSSIERLKDKKVLLIGHNSYKYKQDNFECMDLINFVEIANYYKKIKYIVQDSFYESCSNVKLEGLFNGCKIVSTNS